MNHDALTWWVDLTSILTFIITLIGAAVGIWGYFRYLCGFREKRKSLEDYLKSEKEKGENRGQRSALRITRDIGLTEEEIVKISYKNPKIARRVDSDESGMARTLLFEYMEGEPER